MKSSLLLIVVLGLAAWHVDDDQPDTALLAELPHSFEQRRGERNLVLGMVR